MKTRLSFLGMFALLILAPLTARAQTPASSSNQNPPHQAAPQKPAAPQPSGTNANPFPEDSDAVPVIGSNAAVPAEAPADNASAGKLLPFDDTDPATSPEQAHATAGSSGFSSSLSGMDELLPDPDSGSLNRKGRSVEPVHHADAKEDESVGSYYLGLKNYKAALSRFESALVLDPENPDVYWGLAESQRNLGKFAEARQNYVKVMMYDPGSKHAKDAKKILRQPEFEQASTGGGQSSAPKK
ncbi:MAG: tetratricopeptide repeat protein [Acidobacteriota bacterium]|nr:tetratricopeptide repeat protein [Acidobacteriota bacterium]